MILYQDNFLEASVRDGGYWRSCQIAELIARSGVDQADPGRVGHSLSSFLQAITISVRLLGLHGAVFSKERLAPLSWAIANLQANREVRVLVSERFARFPGNYLAAVGRVPIVAVPHNIESLVPGQPPFIVPSLQRNRQVELNMLRMARACFCISAEDALLLRSEGVDAEVLPYFPAAERLQELTAIREARTEGGGDGPLVVLGSVTNPPTMQATRQLLEVLTGLYAEATPDQRSVWPDAVVAGNGTGQLASFAADKVQVRGRVDDQELRKLLICARCLVVNQVPTTGALTRVTEALLAGVPVVAVRAAARGQEESNGLVLGDSLAEALLMALKIPDGMVCDQPLRPTAAEEAFINTLQRLDRAAKGKQQRPL
jgi:hypothetical protein